MVKIPLETSADIRGAKTLNKELAKTEEQLKKVAKEAKGADLSARRIKEAVEPQRKYNRQVAETALLHKKGKITIDEARFAAAKYTRQLDRAGMAGKRAFGQQALGQVGAMVTGYFSLYSAVGLVRREMEATKAVQERTTQSQLTAHGARRGLLRNLAGVDEKDQKFVVAAANRIAGKQGLTSTVVDTALGAAVSANPDPRQAVRATETLLPLVNDLDGAAVGDFVGAVGDIGNALNTNNIKRALGLLQATVSTGRPTDIRAVAKEAPRVITSYAMEGIDPRKAAGIFAGMTVGGADKTGEISRTASLNLLPKSKAFFKKDARGFAPEDIDTADERIDILLGNKELAKQFMEEAGFRAAGRAGVQALLLNPDGKAREAMLRTMKLAGTPEQQEALGKKALDFVQSGKLEEVVGLNRVVGATTEKIRLSMSSGGSLTEEARQDFYDLMSQTSVGGASGRSTTADAFRTFMRVGPTVDRDEVMQLVEKRLALLERVQAGGFSFMNLDPLARTEEGRAANEKNIEILSQMLEELRRQTAVATQGANARGE